MVLMMNILSKNNSSKNSHGYSLDAIGGMHNQISSLKQHILAAVQVERPNSFAAMKDLLSLPNLRKVTKWGHVEALVKIWNLFCKIPFLFDGSFVGPYTRQSNKLNNNLDTSLVS